MSTSITLCVPVSCTVTVAGLAPFTTPTAVWSTSFLAVLHLLPEILLNSHVFHFFLQPSFWVLPLLPIPCISLSPPSSTLQLISGGWGIGSTKTLSGPSADPVPPFPRHKFSNYLPCLSVFITAKNDWTQRANHRVQQAELCHLPLGQRSSHPTPSTSLAYLWSAAQELSL